MKKVISVLCAMLIICSVSVDAFAAGGSKKEVQNQIKATAEYLFKDKDFTYTSASDFLLYIRSGLDTQSKFEKFSTSFAEALKNGTPLNSYTLACVLLCYSESGYDVSGLSLNGETVDLAELYASSDGQAESVYNYRLMFEASYYLEDETFETFETKIFDDLIKLYEIGSGCNYWGYSCDNDAAFLSALGSTRGLDFDDNAVAVEEDVFKQIEKYRATNGYFYSEEYNTPNADSTAYVLMAKSIYEDFDGADETYDLLQTFAGKDGTYLYDGEESAYAAKDALMALEYYERIANEDAEKTTAGQTTGESTTSATVSDKEEQTTAAVTSTPSTGDSSPLNMIMLVCMGGALLSGIYAVSIFKKHKEK